MMAAEKRKLKKLPNSGLKIEKKIKHENIEASFDKDSLMESYNQMDPKNEYNRDDSRNEYGSNSSTSYFPTFLLKNNIIISQYFNN